LRNIIKLAHNDFIIIQALPDDVPGFGNLINNRIALKKFKDSLQFNKISDYVFADGSGRVILSQNVEKGLEYIKWVKRETLSDLGLKFIKRRQGDSLFYFISNNTAKDIDEKIELNTNANSIVFTDPLNGEAGTVSFEKNENGVRLRIQLKSGQSILIRSNYHVSAKGTKWKYIEPAGDAINLENNNWKLHFTEGGPVLPKDKMMNKIQPWTNFTDDSTTQSFSGTGIYTTSFILKNKATDYLLQLDKLYESARIIINGKDAGLIWSLPFETKIGKFLKEGNNTISIEVRNLMANRIRNMDRNGESWRNYHEINFVNINYKNFDASNWKVQPSGIEGTVKLTPLK